MQTLERMHWIVYTSDGFDSIRTTRISFFHQFSCYCCQSLLGISFESSPMNDKTKYSSVRIRFHQGGWLWLGRLADQVVLLPATVRSLVQIPELSSSDAPKFEWTTIANFVEVQVQHLSVITDTLTFCDGLQNYSESAIWIMEEASGIKLLLCITAHTWPGG